MTAHSTVAKLAVELVGRDADLRRTLDRSKRQGESWGTSLAAAGRMAGVGLTAVTGAAVAAVTAVNALVMENAALGRELQGVAAVGNTSVMEFQVLAYAARSYNLEQSKTGDILKDLQDKMGDFSATGGGEMADFFENVGNAAGVTVDQLRALSGPDALIAIKRALDDANVPMSEQVFYLESIADEASKLLPLLAANGAGYQDLRDQFVQTNSALTESEIGRFDEYARDVDMMNASFAALVRQSVIPFVDELQEGARWFGELFGRARRNKAAEQINELHTEMVGLREEIARTEQSSKKYGAQGEGILDRLGNALLGNTNKDSYLVEKKARLETVKRDLAAAQQLYAELSGMPVTPPGGRPSPAPGGAPADGDLKRQQQEGTQKLAQLQQQFATETELVRMQHEQRLASVAALQLSQQDLERAGFTSLEDLRDSLSAQSRQKMQTALEAIAASEQQQQEQAAARAQQRAQQQAGGEDARVLVDLERIRQQLMTRENAEAEAYDRRQQVLADALQRSLLEEQQYQQLSAKNWQSYQQQLMAMEVARKTEMLQNGAQLFDGLAGMAESLGGRQSKTFRALFAVSKAFAIAESIVKIQQGIANAAALPFPANLGAMATVASATAGILTTIKGTKLGNVAGMAHAGIDAIPREGTWLLDRGERVVSAPQAQRLDRFLEGSGGGAPVINIHNYSGAQVETRDNGQSIDVVIGRVSDDIQRGTGLARTFESVYGLRRQGVV
tara:strand:- start:12037 stop:14238 length:2202 start_codon:yes stop_codon:yes gene_type:complete